MLRRAVALALCLSAVACGGDRRETPSPTPSTADSTPPSSASTPRLPAITSRPIAGLEAAAVHDALAKIGFTRGEPSGGEGFVKITSKRADATVSTYGTSPGDVVKIIAEANPAVAPAVLGQLAATAVPGPEATRAENWVKTELKTRPTSPAQPHAARATYGQVPYELLVTSKSATLSIGRITG